MYHVSITYLLQFLNFHFYIHGQQGDNELECRSVFRVYKPDICFSMQWGGEHSAASQRPATATHQQLKY
jgi:hypothetical protein